MAGPNRCLLTAVIITIVVTGIIAVSSLVMGFLIALYSPEPSDNANPQPIDGGGLGGQVASTMTPEGEEGGHVSEMYYADQRIWLIHIGEYNHRIAYLDDETEQVKGLDADIVHAVCKVSQKRCRLVFDTYSNCYDSEKEEAGLGLKNNYYHACPGWAATFSRARGLAFGEAWSQVASTLWVTSPGNPSNFNPRDLSGRRIGFVRAWFSSPGCANQLRDTQGLPLDERDDSRVEVFDTVESLIEDLESGQIDAGFITDVLFDPSSMQQIGDELKDCTAGDFGIIARPTSEGLEFIDWWNVGMRKILLSREYKDICDRLETVHGHKDGGPIEEICLTQYL